MSSNNQIKKVEYDFVPTVALSVIVLVIVTIVIVAVIFVWNLLSKTSSDALTASQGQIQTSLINDQGQVLDVLGFRQADRRLIEQGGVDVVSKAQVKPVAQAMQELLTHPSYLSTLPEPTAVPAPQPRTPEVLPPPARVPDPRVVPTSVPTTRPAPVAPRNR